MTADRSRAWGERTPTQRLITYSIFATASVAAAVVWYGGSIEPAGIGPLGYAVFPVAAVLFLARAVQAYRERASSPATPDR